MSPALGGAAAAGMAMTRGLRVFMTTGGLGAYVTGLELPSSSWASGVVSGAGASGTGASGTSGSGAFRLLLPLGLHGLRFSGASACLSSGVSIMLSIYCRGSEEFQRNKQQSKTSMPRQWDLATIAVQKLEV